ncbi:MAG: zinc-ribbon domain containing protein [Pyrinomonadaceae bacterium]
MSDFDNKPSEGSELSGSPAEDFKDIEILCIDCDREFSWSCGEQRFFMEKGLKNPPKRCKPCKTAKNERIRAIKNAKNGGKCQKIEVAVSCATCSTNTTVPFYPSQGRPVYCRSCYIEQNPGLLDQSEN